MRRVLLALVACVAAATVVGCVTTEHSEYELIPGVPFPATYLVNVTPQGYDVPIPVVHRLSITAPTAVGGHDFEFSIQPIGTLQTAGAFEVSTARSPASAPEVRGRSVKVSVASTEYASAAQFMGVVGYEGTGAVLANSGTVQANFRTDSDGYQVVSGTYALTTANTAVAPLFRTYRGTFEGLIATDDGEGGGGGTGPPDPPA